MKTQTLIIAGLCGLMMTSMSFGSPGTNSSEMVYSAIVRPNSPQVKTVNLSAAELGQVNHTGETRKVTHGLSWKTKAAGFTGFVGTVVVLAVYVHLS